MTAQRYSQCPKCDHAPLPHDQRFPAACPQCGLILARHAEALTASELRERARAQTHEENSDEDSLLNRLKALAIHVPEQVDSLSFWGRVVTLALFTLWGLVLIGKDIRTGEIFNNFIHGPLLVFHEAGHVIFMLFGEFITVAGGTLGQLIMPAVLMGALLWRRDPFGAAIGLWLFGVSILDVAPYVYDAKEPYLVLLGGHTGETGGHDWIYLLSHLGLREASQSLGWWVHKLGALVVFTSLAWGGLLLWRQKQRVGFTLED